MFPILIGAILTGCVYKESEVSTPVNIYGETVNFNSVCIDGVKYIYSRAYMTAKFLPDGKVELCENSIKK